MFLWGGGSVATSALSLFSPVYKTDLVLLCAIIISDHFVYYGKPLLRLNNLDQDWRSCIF